MGIRRENAEAGSWLDVGTLLSHTIFRPAQDLTKFGNESDPTAISVGDNLVTHFGGTPFTLAKTGLQFFYTDAAGGNFGGQLRVEGINHLGVRIDELVNLSGAAPATTGRAWLQIDTVEVLAWDNADAADTFTIGLDPSQNTNATRLRMGFPILVEGDQASGVQDDYFAMVQVNPPADAGDIVVPQQVNFLRQTFTIDNADATGKQYVFVLNPKNPKL